MTRPEDFILLLQEVRYHPNSYLEKLDSRFEMPSVIRVTRKDELAKYSKPPMFDERYLVLFDNLRALKNNKAYLSFSIMFPVLKVETSAQLEDAKFFCKESSIPYQAFVNSFTREDAIAMIQNLATEVVDDAVIKAIIRQVGLNPTRIITAISVCEQVGYSVQNVERYVDKWVYPDLRKLIENLLGVPSSAVSIRRSMQYLYVNRHWYRYVQKNIVDELNIVLGVYRDKLAGEVYSENLYNYIEEKQLTRSVVMFALQLFDKVSIASVFALREFINEANLMDVVLRLS